MHENNLHIKLLPTFVAFQLRVNKDDITNEFSQSNCFHLLRCQTEIDQLDRQQDGVHFIGYPLCLESASSTPVDLTGLSGLLVEEEEPLVYDRVLIEKDCIGLFRKGRTEMTHQSPLDSSLMQTKHIGLQRSWTKQLLAPTGALIMLLCYYSILSTAAPF